MISSNRYDVAKLSLRQLDRRADALGDKVSNAVVNRLTQHLGKTPVNKTYAVKVSNIYA